MSAAWIQLDTKLKPIDLYPSEKKATLPASINRLLNKGTQRVKQPDGQWAYPKDRCVEACAGNHGDLLVLPVGWYNSFLECVGTAFSHHYTLILSPDDVWLAIAQGFARHVNKNAEELRDRFVKHQGKQLIKVRRDDFIKGSPDNPWPNAFAEFSQKIGEHVGKLQNLVTDKFSTTGPVEQAAYDVTLMDAMQQYFEYRMCTLCGIPAVQLLGTPEDWKLLRQRAAVLGEYKLEWWMKELLPVLDEFCTVTKTGKFDRDFWRSIYKYDSMSGGDTVSGWINVFFPYMDDDHINRCLGWQTMDGPESNDYQGGLRGVPFVWEYYGQEFPMDFVSGFAGVAANESTKSVRPIIGWAVRDAVK